MTRRRIESETKAQIKVPKPGIEGDIVVIGPTRKSVASARRRIEIIVLAARNKQQFTHFLSVPFRTDEIKRSFIRFRDEIMAGSPVYGLDSSLFQNPTKLHLTLGTLSLMDNEDRATAAQLLRDCDETVIKRILREEEEANAGRILIEMCGVEYMNDDPGAVDILYGKVSSEPLQRIADAIIKYFIQKGLMQLKYDRVKMHVTLINSLFRQDERSDGGNVRGWDDRENGGVSDRRKTFDARDIIKKYERFYFGKFELSEIHLSQRYSTGCDGFYEATGIIKI